MSDPREHAFQTNLGNLIVDRSSSARGHIPAYFLSLTVGNVRCFGPEQTLDLSRSDGKPAQWTVILGENGVGKTTLLQCLALLQPAPARLRSSGKHFLMPTAGSVLANGFASVDFYESVFTSPRGNPVVVESVLYDGVRLADARKRGRASVFGLRLIGEELNFRTGSKVGDLDEDTAIVCFGYGASRKMGVASLARIQEGHPSESLFSDSSDLINAEEWLLQADYAASKQSHIQGRAVRMRDQVRDILIHLLPDVSDIRYAQQGERGLTPAVEFETPYGWVQIKDLSLGYRTLTAWMVDLASRLVDRYPNSKDPLTEPAIVLVDEIDLHLHPKWQRKLISYLTERFPNTQFIVTAHSPLIVQAATDANIVLLRREGDHVVIDNDVEAIRGWRIDQVLTSDLFGLETARPPEYDAAIQERTKLLSKAKLTKKDQARLKRLEAQIGNLPAGETAADAAALDVIRRAADLLRREEAASR